MEGTDEGGSGKVEKWKKWKKCEKWKSGKQVSGPDHFTARRVVTLKARAMSWIAVVGTTILAMATTLSARNRKPDHYLDGLGVSRSATSLAAPYVPWDTMSVSVSHPVFDTT